MSVERGRSAAARHSYSTAAASAGRVRTNERLRPGTVALRVQALNQNLQAHHFQPSSGPEPNLPEASDQPTGRLSQGESLPDLFRSSDVQAESVGRYSTSNGEPFLPRGTRSSFGKRTGGGWAPPAGRRSTLHDTSAQPAEWARSVKAAGSRMNLPDGDNPGRPSVSRSERGDASTSIPQSSIRGMGGPGYNTARAYSRSNGLQYFPEHPEGGIASHSAQRSYKPVTPAANHAPRGPSGMVSQIALPHGLPTASWDAPSAIPSPLTSGRAGGPPQNSLRQHIDSARHPNTWKHTNTAYSPIVGQPSPSIAQVMQGQRKNMSLLTSTRSEAGAPRISDAPLMWSPESYDSNDQTTGNSEPFPGFAGHQVSMESLDALGRQQGRPFSFNSDIEEELSTVRHSSQVEGQRLLRDSRKQSASQVSLETLLLQHRSSKEVTGAAATANGSGSRRSQATPKKTPSGLLSFIPRLLGRNESQPYDDLEEGRREDDPPGPRRSKELRTALDRDMLRIPAAPGLFEPEAPSMGYNRPSSVFVDARRGFAQAVSPYTAMQDAPPVEPEAPFRVGELGTLRAGYPHGSLKPSADRAMAPSHSSLSGQASSNGYRRSATPAPAGVDQEHEQQQRPQYHQQPPYFRFPATSPRPRQPSQLSSVVSSRSRVVAHAGTRQQTPLDVADHASTTASTAARQQRKFHVVINMDESADVNLSIMINGQGQAQTQTQSQSLVQDRSDVQNQAHSQGLGRCRAGTDDERVSPMTRT